MKFLEGLQIRDLNNSCSPLDFAQKGLPHRLYSSYLEAWQDFEQMTSPKYTAMYKRENVGCVVAENGNNNQYNYSNEGLFFDIDAVISGQPEHWLTVDTGNKPLLEIFIEYGVYHKYTAGEVANWSFMIADLYNTLVTSYKLKISIKYAISTGEGKPDLIFNATICDYDEYLNESKLLYILSPMFYRLFVFAAFEKAGLSSSTGFPAGFSTKESYQKGTRLEGNKLTIVRLSNKCYKDPEPRLKDWLKLFGIHR
jgi:hypothetical protein